MLALSTGGDNAPYDEYEDLDEGPFYDYSDAVNFRDHELHPTLAGASRIRGGREGMYTIEVPRLLRQRIIGTGQADVLNPSHAVHAPAEPDYHDPAHPKVTAWHNDIAYTVPVHPQALSKEHMQALADYEVHRRQHEKLRQQWEAIPENSLGDSAAARRYISLEARVARSEQRLNHLRNMIQGAGHLAMGLRIPTQRYVKKTFYQAVAPRRIVGSEEQGEIRGDVSHDRKTAEQFLQNWPQRRIEEFPGIWSVVNEHGAIMDSGLRSHRYFNQRNFMNPEYREMMLRDARNKILSARHLWNRFHEAPWIDMSKLPIQTYGSTRKKTGEWFSNLPPGMQAGKGGRH